MDEDASGSNVPERNISDHQNQNDLTTTYDSDSSGLPTISPKSLAELLLNLDGVNESGQGIGTTCDESGLLEEGAHAGHQELFPISTPPASDYDGVGDALTLENSAGVQQVGQDQYDDFDPEESFIGVRELPDTIAIPDFEEEGDSEVDGDEDELEVEDNREFLVQNPSIVDAIIITPPIPAAPLAIAEGTTTYTDPSPSSITSRSHRKKLVSSDATNDNVESSPAKRPKSSRARKPKDLSDEEWEERRKNRKAYRKRKKQELADAKTKINALEIENASLKNENQNLTQQLIETRAYANIRPDQLLENIRVAIGAAAQGKTLVVPQNE